MKRNISLVAAFILFLFAGVATAAVTNTINTQQPGRLVTNELLSATTSTATSTNTGVGGGYMTIAGAKKVMFYFTHGGVATTSTSGARFTIETSPDGSTWNTYNHLIGSDVSQTATTSITVSGATTTATAAMDLLKEGFFAVRCISTELTALGTAGEHTCTAQAEF